MHFTALRGLEGNWTDGALVKNFTVFLLDVSLLSLKGLENHIAVKTSGRTNGNLMPLSFNTVLYAMRPLFYACLLTCTRPCERSADSFP